MQSGNYRSLYEDMYCSYGFLSFQLGEDIYKINIDSCGLTIFK